ncbi:hypothetical protein CBE90_00825 [Pasteurella multocida]|uniref:hypothetical protein n=1 Tax=Pasteurella multocida TaxID=747 RepID=UPI000CE7D657|nr:hypothetical protein [Pasteurella multocida]PPE96295.1 hypothetical protein CBE90_00825 [Pasteurella multocida]PPE97203.1 hypothetical protein CBE91_03855 [Pasteurella multocida]
MRYEDENGFIVRFKLDEYLRIRAMKFRDFAETARMLRSASPAKYGILTEYLNCQYHVLNRIIKNTLNQPIENLTGYDIWLEWKKQRGEL